MKVLLTGESGILGTDIKKQLQLEGYDVLGFNSQNINIVDFESVMDIMNDFKPELVIHSAAMTDVDRCEDEHDLAYAINVTGTENMSKASAKIDAKLVYISSCGVYGNGKASPYHETDNTQPVNYHHFTKLEGEKQVKIYNKNHLIIRPGWLFGGTPEHKKNFVRARREEAANNPVLKSAFDKSGSPTYTKDVALQIAYLINKEVSGTFNVVNEGEASRFSYVAEIIRLSELPVTVEPVSSGSFLRKANMPENERLENRNLNLIQANVMRHWKTALEDYINSTF